MNPALSQRIGKLMIANAIIALDWDEKMEFVGAVIEAESFEDLAENIQAIVLEAEEEFN